MDSTARWYFTHETEADRLWHQLFFSMCKKFGVDWAKANPVQKAFIEEITRYNFDAEMAKRNGGEQPVKGFFDGPVSA